LSVFRWEHSGDLFYSVYSDARGDVLSIDRDWRRDVGIRQRHHYERIYRECHWSDEWWFGAGNL
jgi:hypothetical protein